MDYKGLDRLIEHILLADVSAIFLLGTTGEGPSLSYRLRKELITRVSAQVDQKVPLLVGITDTSFVESIRLAEAAAENGVVAAVLSTPYYFPLSQKDLLDLAIRTANESPLPIFLYNMPSLTKVSFGPELVKEAVKHPKILGIKDSSGDLDYLENILNVSRQNGKFPVFVGPEHLLATALQKGADGGVCGGANLNPQLFVNLYQAARAGRWNEVSQYHEEIVRMGNAIYSIGDEQSSYLRGLKTALSLTGICNDLPALPNRPFSETERLMLEQNLSSLYQPQQ